MERCILHCDCNGFYASVECLLRPELLDKPVAVAGNAENRHGIILAKNEVAKAFGISTAETIWQAQKKCPQLVLVPPQHEAYARFSVLINEIYNDFTDLVEPFGIDESWLDVTGVQHLFGDGKTIADTIRERVRTQLGLTISVGVSFNKIFAKLGSDYKKPDATTVITRDNFKEIVYPLPASALLYVGQSAAKSLAKQRIFTIGDLAKSDPQLLVSSLGKSGQMIWDYANGLDKSPVRPAAEKPDLKTVGNGMTFRRNLLDLEDCRGALIFLADEVAGRLRKHGFKCASVSITIKSPRLESISRQKPLVSPTHLSHHLVTACMELLSENWDFTQPIRMLTITAMHLLESDGEAPQMNLFEDREETRKQESLAKAMDKIRDKYGKGAISLGGTGDIGISE